MSQYYELARRMIAADETRPDGEPSVLHGLRNDKPGDTATLAEVLRECGVDEALRARLDVCARLERVFAVMRTATADSKEGLADMLCGALRGEGFTPNAPRFVDYTHRGPHWATWVDVNGAWIEQYVTQSDDGQWTVRDVYVIGP
jgi:hypothetical protein